MGRDRKLAPGLAVAGLRCLPESPANLSRSLELKGDYSLGRAGHYVVAIETLKY